MTLEEKQARMRDRIEKAAKPQAPREAYTAQEVARMTGFSARSILRWFANEPGVLVLDQPETLHKRRYRAIRIPKAVVNRFFAKLGCKKLC